MCVNPDHLESKTSKDHAQHHKFGSEKCKPGCTCNQHKRHWEKRIGRDPRSKLNQEKVLEIRALAKEGSSRKYIANKFNIAVNTVCNVVNYKAWAHIP